MKLVTTTLLAATLILKVRSQAVEVIDETIHLTSVYPINISPNIQGYPTESRPPYQQVYLPPRLPVEICPDANEPTATPVNFPVIPRPVSVAFPTSPIPSAPFTPISIPYTPPPLPVSPVPSPIPVPSMPPALPVPIPTPSIPVSVPCPSIPAPMPNPSIAVPVPRPSIPVPIPKPSIPVPVPTSPIPTPIPIPSIPSPQPIAPVPAPVPVVPRPSLPVCPSTLFIHAFPTAVQAPISLIQTTVVDNQLSNSLANVLQLLIASKLLSNTAYPYKPCLSEIGPFYDAVGTIGTVQTLASPVVYPFPDFVNEAIPLPFEFYPLLQ